MFWFSSSNIMASDYACGGMFAQLTSYSIFIYKYQIEMVMNMFGPTATLCATTTTILSCATLLGLTSSEHATELPKFSTSYDPGLIPPGKFNYVVPPLGLILRNKRSELCSCGRYRHSPRFWAV